MAQEPPPYQFYQQPLPPPQPQMGIGGQYGQVRPRRRRRVWPWIIAAIILFAVIGGNMGHSFEVRGPFDKSSQAQQVPFAQTQLFKVGSSPTIVINDAQGSTVHIQSGGGQPVVTVQTDGPGNAAVTQSDTQIHCRLPNLPLPMI